MKIDITKVEEQIIEQQKTVDFDTREFTIEILVQKYLDHIDDEENELFVPDYQREFVWDSTRQSRLIESLILGLPIPIIFVAENDDGRLEIVDGSQRIRTLSAFLKDELVLQELEKLSCLNGLKYSELKSSRKRKSTTNSFGNRNIKNTETTTCIRCGCGSDLLKRRISEIKKI